MKKPTIARSVQLNIPSNSSLNFSNRMTQKSPSLDHVYTIISSTPSSYISDPTSNRKLLVLDLNGTLLFRPKRYMKTTHSVPGSNKHRVVHPRPYMASFRGYLFHPLTKKWLDTMVWSSAQPHSVKDMVQHSFGDCRGELKTVWARDTLDLDPTAYNKKSVTIKDLTKLWKAFPPHSPRTTLLVDDSTQKARLQPWNHIFVKEYGQTQRRSDLDHLHKQLTSPQDSESRPESDNKLDLSDLLVNMTLSTSVASTRLASPPSSTVFDSILLAVIGILEAIKHQDNVSGWLKNGGIVLCGAEGVMGGGRGTIGDRWFDTVHIVEWWANRGRAALVELNIDEVAGVVVNR
ncbi:NLI interacting factor-like phosphatase-domain-containing protein [Lentinula aciculospora]|uniref:Mitochondrial import inner membrane translocase subunit TIM50 n=1 Tax=Lentinula aciculospora TaxID=153920 RepID=A0A9W8ZYT9_9AGAR|nr:NLI interacting factor-like phosphatase-domain-containing protein [Lentinula aciculospora]